MCLIVVETNAADGRTHLNVDVLAYLRMMVPWRRNVFDYHLDQCYGRTDGRTDTS